MTEQKENPPQVSSDVETPIDLREVSKEQLAFYLTERAPVPVSKFAEECVQNETEVGRILRDRFRAQINIDATDFLQLTGDARRPVIKAGKPFIKRGRQLFSDGKSLSDEEKHEQAAVQFQQAAAIFESIRTRFGTVDYVPEKLDELITAVKKHHDSAAKEAAKQKINYQLLKTRQHESEGDQNTERKPSRAANEYQKALDALSEAIETALRYNQSRLQSDGSHLSVEPLKEEQASIEKKSQQIDKRSSETSEQKVEADSTTSPGLPPSSSDSDAREAMLEVVRDLHKQLGRVPKTTELPKGCEYSPNDFYNEFGTWDETLEAAGIDKEQALLDDIERVAEKLGHVPNSSDMDEHGTYSGSNYSSYFGSWTTALERSGVNDDHEETLLETLQSLHDRLGRLPKTTDLGEVSGTSQHDYIRSFGSWDEALEAAGIDKQQHLVDDLKRVTAEVNGKPGTPDVDQFGTYSSGMHQKYFRSWDAALEAAGLSTMGTATENKKRTEGKSGGAAAMSTSTPVEDITSHINSVGPRSISRLQSAGYTTLGSLYNVEPREIAKHRGIGRKKAIELVRFATENVSKERAASTEQSGKRASAPTSSNGTDATSGKRAGSSTLDPDTPLDDIKHRVDGVGHSSISAVKKAGYNTLGELCDAQLRDVTKYKGIGKTKAQTLIRFATENVSTNGVSSGQSSKAHSSTNRSSSSTTGMRSDRIQPSALDSSWETIPPNERIDGQFLLQVTGVDRQAGDRKTARLDVWDQNGRAFGMNIWSKHNVNREWSEGEWYALENARGKVWESSDGTTQKQLSSTKDISVIELGSEFDSDVLSTEDTSGTGPTSQQPGVATSEGISEGMPNSAVTNRDTAATDGDEDSSEDGNLEVDNDDLLDDIMSDFDEI